MRILGYWDVKLEAVELGTSTPELHAGLAVEETSSWKSDTRAW